MQEQNETIFPESWWKEKTEYHSIDNERLFHSERPMADLEFAYKPFSKPLLKETLIMCIKQIGKTKKHSLKLSKLGGDTFEAMISYKISNKFLL